MTTLSWTYIEKHSGAVIITDGRQTMHLYLYDANDIYHWFQGGCLYNFNTNTNVLAYDDPLTWHGFALMPVVGRVRKTVHWPREEVRQIIRAIHVAERLRARSEPHTLYTVLEDYIREGVHHYE